MRQSDTLSKCSSKLNQHKQSPTIYPFLKLHTTTLTSPFQSSLLGGIGVVEVAVGTVTAAVLIRGNIEPSHFGFLHAGNREESDAASNTGLLLSLLVNRPAQLPAKVQAVRQDRSARPPPAQVT